MAENFPAALWTTDTALCFTFMTGAGLTSINAAPYDFLGAPVTHFFPQTGAGVTPLTAHQRALRGHASGFDIEVMGRTLHARVSPLYTPKGQLAGVTGVALDNTERSVAENALRLSEQSYRSLIEEASYAICRSTRSGQLLQVNRAMAEMLGYESESELLLDNMRSGIFPEPELYDEFIGRLMGTGSHGLESTWRRQDGRHLFVSLGGRAVRDPKGHIAYFDIVAENVTERKQLEDQLRQAQKMQAVGQLAGGIAHDFNNLLTVIKGYVELVLAEVPEHDPMRPCLEQVDNAAERAATLTKQLLAFGRIHTSKGKLVDLNAAVADMTQMLGRLIGENIDFTFAPGQDPMYVRTDPGQIEQVLMNLVLNARDAMPEGGRLTVSTTGVRLDATSHPELPAGEAGDYVALVVTDTGHGMSAETRARIYEPFFTTKRQGRGTGLGLFTVYGIARQNKGQIYADSEPGKGTTFQFCLPRLAVPEETGTLVRTDPVPGGAETILLAEDEDGIRRLTAAYLAKSGYRVLSAADGIEARDLARGCDGKIDLLLSDVMMPRMGGRELAEELRRTLPGLKVVLMSGYTGDSTIHEATLPPNTLFLQKPFSSLQTLSMKIREALDGPICSESDPPLPRFS